MPMQEFNASFRKNMRGDPEVVTLRNLTEKIILTVETRKSWQKGTLKTVAEVHCRTESGYHTRTVAIFSKDPLQSDYSKDLNSKVARATEKAMKDLHAEAIAAFPLEVLTKEALAHTEARIAAGHHKD